MSIDVLYPKVDNDIKQCIKRMKNHGSFHGPHLINVFKKPEIQSPNFNYTAYLSMNSENEKDKSGKERTKEKNEKEKYFVSHFIFKRKIAVQFHKNVKTKILSFAKNKMMHLFAASFYCS